MCMLRVPSHHSRTHCKETLALAHVFSRDRSDIDLARLSLLSTQINKYIWPQKYVGIICARACGRACGNCPHVCTFKVCTLYKHMRFLCICSYTHTHTNTWCTPVHAWRHAWTGTMNHIECFSVRMCEQNLPVSWKRVMTRFQSWNVSWHKFSVIHDLWYGKQD